MTVSVWLRAVRARFMAASAVAVAAGLAASWHGGHAIGVADAILTLAGVLALHASVDLLNDYWDHRRGIDAHTTRTPFSGGTGVIADGALSPQAVRAAGLLMMGLGVAAGAYFVLMHGLPIALILAFAVASVYFYSTRVVDSGLGRGLCRRKGGAHSGRKTAYIQTGALGETAAAAGVCVGILSSIVLLVTSFPDHDADRLGGRRTLVVAIGRTAAASVFWVFVAAFGAALVVSISLGVLPPECAISLAALPLAFSAGRMLRRHHSDAARLVPAMQRTVLFGRIAGALVVVGLVI